jgi:hypothetical protein
MTSETTVDAGAKPLSWLLHDLVVGVLTGFGVGLVAGVFANRLVETGAFILVIGAVGAIAGAYVLVQSHVRSDRFINSVVVVSWVLLACSCVFLVAVIQAILDFN